MLLSIIIPAYNAEKYIVENLDRIIKQDFFDYEIIIVNDGSKDRTQVICEEYILKHQNNKIKLIEQSNAGVSVARNEGIKAAEGEWITFVDADDYLFDGTLLWFSTIDLSNLDVVNARIVLSSQVIHHESVEFSITKLNAIDSEILLRCVLRYPKYSKTVQKLYEVDPYVNWSSCGKFYRKKLLIENSITYPKGIFTSEDVVFLCKIYSVAKNILASNRIIYFYRENEVSATHTFNKKLSQNNVMVIECIENILLKDDRFRNDFYSYVSNLWIDTYLCYRKQNDDYLDEYLKGKKMFLDKNFAIHIKNSPYFNVFCGKRRKIKGGFILLIEKLRILFNQEIL